MEHKTVLRAPPPPAAESNEASGDADDKPKQETGVPLSLRLAGPAAPPLYIPDVAYQVLPNFFFAASRTLDHD